MTAKKPLFKNYIAVKITDIDLEIDRLKALLATGLSNPYKNYLQGQLEAYLAFRMQEKIFIAPVKTTLN